MLKTVMSRSAIIALACALSLSAHAMADGTKHAIHIPSGELAVALELLAKQSGTDLVYRPDQVAGFRTGGIAGELSTEEAVTRLLKGTPLTLSTDSTGAMLIALPAPVTTGAGEKATPTPQAIELDEIVVTGSRLKVTDASAAPVIVLDRARLDQLGVTTVADALRYLPQQSFTVPEQNNATQTRLVQLRGLAFGNSLVLIDGRRTVSSAISAASNAFDLNTVPLAAVERIEVLSDSASAVYGSDAVGGVVNIILNKKIDQPVVDLMYGAAEGGADERRASVSFGHQGERLRASMFVDYFDRAFLLGAERDRYANQDFRRFGGADRRMTTTNPGNVSSTNPSVNLPGLSSPVAAVPDGSTGVGLTPADFQTTAGEVRRDSIGRFHSVVPEATRRSAAGFVELDLPANMTGFAELLYSNRDGSLLGLGAGGASIPGLSNRAVQASNPFNPFGVTVNVNYRLEGVPVRIDAVESETYRTVLGVRGSVGSWDWELAGLNIKDDGVGTTYNVLNNTRVTQALAASDPAQALNVFRDGPAGSPELLASLLSPPTVSAFESDASQVGAFFRGPLLRLPAGELQAVVGAEMRDEEQDFAIPGSNIVFNADRSSWSAYTELRVPLFGEDVQPRLVERLTLTLAGRFDHYSDFGGTFNPQYGLEWKPLSRLLLRASYATSFRAPSFIELYQPGTQLPSGNVGDPRRNNLPITGATFLSGGNPDLQAEEANSFTFGFVLTPVDGSGPRFSATYWRIEQEQRVQRPSIQVLLANESFFPERFVRDTPSAEDIALGRPGPVLSVDGTTLNSGELETSGVDLELTGAFDVFAGRIALNLLATWVGKYDAADYPTAPIIERVALANASGSIPRWRTTASAAFNRAAWSLSATTRYVSPYDDVNNANVRTGRELSPEPLFDLQASLHLTELFSMRGLERLTLRAGVVNVFDEEPEFSEVSTQHGFDLTQGDIRQRFGYLSLSAAF
jgi:iron complex outermembrane recepter protein